MTDPISPLAGDLCTACGLCCSGRMFNSLHLDPAEIGLAATLRLPIGLDDEGPMYAFPCPRLEDNRCTVYDQRPSGCRTYRCGLLKRVDADDIGFDEAMGIVDDALKAALLVEAELGGETIPQYRLRRAEALLDRGEALPRTSARDRLNELDAILDRHFRKAEQNQTIPFDAVEGRGG